MKLCFVANYTLTQTQLALSIELGKQGIKSYFITVNKKIYEQILNNGITMEDVLYLPYNRERSYQAYKKYPIKFNDLVYSDRALKFSIDDGLAYLHNIADKITDFLGKHAIEFVIGETTWAHERLISQLSQFMGGVQYLVPHTIRIPDNRWVFFKGENQDAIFELDKVFYYKEEENTRLNYKQPSYVARNNELLRQAVTLRSRLMRIKRFLSRENIDKNDPTHIQSRLVTIYVKGGEELNRILYKLVPRTKLTTEMYSEKFILYALHKQPESSIDVLGRYYEDQEKLISFLWRSLPSDWRLYVKEHSNAIGDRSIFFYNRLNSMPNVRLIHEHVSSSDLIRLAKAVFTVTGTIAFEAALQGIPSFTFVPMYFNRLKMCQRITIDDLRNVSDISKLIASMSECEGQSSSHDDLLKYSLPGRFTDFLSDPSVLHDANIKSLVRGFKSLKC